MFTKMLHADSIQSGLSDNVRHFLQKCLCNSTWILGSRQSRLRRNDTTRKAIIQLENAEGQSLASIFKLRFIKLVWYRAFVSHAISQGWLAWPIATADLYALMPDLNTKYFDQFLRSFVPFADIPTTQRIQALVLAGLRYDYLCHGEYHEPNSLPNEGNLFLLPDSVSAYQWECELPVTELFPIRKHLHCAGMKQLAGCFPGGSSSLNELAHQIIEHYAVYPKFPSFLSGTPLSYDACNTWEVLVKGGKDELPQDRTANASTTLSSAIVDPGSSDSDPFLTFKSGEEELVQPTPTMDTFARSVQHPPCIPKTCPRKDATAQKRLHSSRSASLYQAAGNDVGRPAESQAYQRVLKSPRLLTGDSVSESRVSQLSQEPSMLVPNVFDVTSSQARPYNIPHSLTNTYSAASPKPFAHWAWPTGHSSSEATLRVVSPTHDEPFRQDMVPSIVDSELIPPYAQVDASFGHDHTYPAPPYGGHSFQPNTHQHYGQRPRSQLTPSSRTKRTPADLHLVPLLQNAAPAPRTRSPESHGWAPQEWLSYDPPGHVDPASATAVSVEIQTVSQVRRMTSIDSPRLKGKQRTGFVSPTQQGSSPAGHIKKESEGGQEEQTLTVPPEELRSTESLG
ncbi:MAG: hypothetical protein Q9202_001649 [Teloschistes flavicans]